MLKPHLILGYFGTLLDSVCLLSGPCKTLAPYYSESLMHGQIPNTFRIPSPKSSRNANQDRCCWWQKQTRLLAMCAGSRLWKWPNTAGNGIDVSNCSLELEPCVRSWAAAAAIRRAPFKSRAFHVQLVAEALARHIEERHKPNKKQHQVWSKNRKHNSHATSLPTYGSEMTCT